MHLSHLLPTVALVASATAQDVIPETPAGRVATAWIEAFNAGDRDSMFSFVKVHRTPDKVASFDESWAQLGGARQTLGSMTPTSSTATPTGITVVCTPENLPIPFALTFVVDTEPPHHMLSMEMRPAGTAGPAIEVPESWDTLEDLLGPIRDSSGAPALAAAIVEGGRIVDFAAVGRRSTDEESARVKPNDMFHIGSCTKSMTASMIGRLVEDGALDWGDTIGSAFDDLELAPGYAERTLLEVLQHRAGIAPVLTLNAEDDARWSGAPGSATDERAAFVAELLQRPPSTKGTFEYSNGGYALAGHWAELATGRAWEDLVQEHVFDALRMKASTFGWPASEARPDAPRGHFSEPGGLRVQGLDEYPLGDFMAPAGDVSTSARDLARYAVAHLNGLVGREDFLRPETVRKLHEPLPGAPYACGWQIVDGVHAHEGSAGTFHARIEVIPAQDRAVVVLVNAPLPDVCAAVSKAIGDRAAAAR